MVHLLSLHDLRMATDYFKWVGAMTSREQELEALLREARTVIDSELSGHGHDHWDKQGNHGRTCPRCIVQRDAGGFDMLRKIDAALAAIAEQPEQYVTAKTPEELERQLDEITNSAEGEQNAAQLDVSVPDLPCGHPAALLVKSVESDYQYCDLCECRKRRNDAEEMERTHLAKLNKGNENAARYLFLRSDQHTFAVFMPRQHGHIAFMEEGLDEKIDEAIRKRTDMNNGGSDG